MEAALVFKQIKKIGRHLLKRGVRWSGPYSSWEEASKLSKGYDDKEIFKKTTQAAQEVMSGRARYERDSVLFNDQTWSFEILTALSYAEVLQNEVVDIIDFGGSLGSLYFKNLAWIKKNPKRQWKIVEQPHYVDWAKRNIKADQLSFYETIEQAFDPNKKQILVLSAVIHYLENPFDFISDILKKYPFYGVYIDRTPYLQNDQSSFVSIQKIPASIYEASYPCWFFRKQDVLDLLKPQYQLVFESESLDRCDDFPVIFQGLFLLRK